MLIRKADPKPPENQREIHNNVVGPGFFADSRFADSYGPAYWA